jgi:hypothetical protein
MRLFCDSLVVMFWEFLTLGLFQFLFTINCHKVLKLNNYQKYRLLLLYTTIQFLSREPFRRVCISSAKSHKWAQIVNLLILSSVF